jgi:hypothetical protein
MVTVFSHDVQPLALGKEAAGLQLVIDGLLEPARR